MIEQPTIVARMTSNGRGAVATVRLAGDIGRIESEPPLFRAANQRPICRQPLGRIVFGQWGIRKIEDIVVCRASDGILDIHSHGGDVAAERILSQLVSRGCTMTTWHQMMRVTDGVLTSELTNALARSTTLRAAEILLEQANGVLRSSVESMLLAEDAQRGDILRSLLRFAKFGLHLSIPWNVVLFGRPNAGKSSLINALVGYNRSIVYDEPGTTRDVVAVETALDGWPIRLFDTAGICESDNKLEATGIERARQQLSEADCKILVIDESQPSRADEQQLIADSPDAIYVAHKCDLPSVRTDRDLPKSAIRVSSLTGDGLSALVTRVVGTVIPELPEPGSAIPVTIRQVELLEIALDALGREQESRFRAALASFLT